MNWLEPIELEHETVKLLPLKIAHLEALLAAAQDGNLWELWFTGVPSESTIEDYIKRALADQELGLALPFSVWHKPTNKIIGCTRFCNVVAKNKRLEIGFTWYAKSFQKTSVNTECKQLLLKHAFEKQLAIAVEFRTHWHNVKSQAAIRRLGAKQDGILRNHTIEADGVLRDTVVFSIINSEWPSVKKSLDFKLQQMKQL
ncbi:GNAT family N-acetyltransferase [Psychrosphaera algicola]|uniref:GNAT family protein n=1 Tax=Psychrosphaera algicola TaxID=3023714 RepID=A0ABT5FB41_9GAMM|nr:GNAT family protein [Psychrosphaera sp. G1-22]MDC2888152.1 GNAT family protein [Psychrosphaera sp. G1-22]